MSSHFHMDILMLHCMIILNHFFVLHTKTWIRNRFAPFATLLSLELQCSLAVCLKWFLLLLGTCYLVLLLALPKGLCHSELLCKTSNLKCSGIQHPETVEEAMSWGFSMFFLAKTLLKLRFTRFLQNVEFKERMASVN